MQCLLLVWVTGKQHDYSGAIHATIVRGLELDLKHGSRLGLVREDLAHAAHKYSSDFQKKRRTCAVVIKQESREDTRSVLSAENQTKNPFVASLVVVAFCQLLSRIIRGNAELTWNLRQTLPSATTKLRPYVESAKQSLHTIAPQRALLGLWEKAQKRQVRAPQSSWSCFGEGEC